MKQKKMAKPQRKTFRPCRPRIWKNKVMLLYRPEMSKKPFFCTVRNGFLLALFRMKFYGVFMDNLVIDPWYLWLYISWNDRQKSNVKAIAQDSSNKVFYSNRSAAYMKAEDFRSALRWINFFKILIIFLKKWWRKSHRTRPNLGQGLLP